MNHVDPVPRERFFDQPQMLALRTFPNFFGHLALKNRRLNPVTRNCRTFRSNHNRSMLALCNSPIDERQNLLRPAACIRAHRQQWISNAKDVQCFLVEGGSANGLIAQRPKLILHGLMFGFWFPRL